jgi:HSP20 family protein
MNEDGGVTTMTLVRRPSPFGEILSLRQAMDRLFDDSFLRSPFDSPTWSSTAALPLDVVSTTDALLVEAALPGIAPEEVDITVEGGTLTIAGSYRADRSEGEGDYLVREMRRGSFSRTISLPDGLEPDRASATFENGLLSLRIPKAEQVRPRQIRITPGATLEGTHPDAEREGGEPGERAGA